jgi:hypothetical protein
VIECFCGWKDGELHSVCSAHVKLIQTNKDSFIAGYKLGYSQHKTGSYCYPDIGYNQWQDMMRKGNNTL